MQPNQPTPEQGPPQPSPESAPDENRPETIPQPATPEKEAPRGDQAAQGDASFTSLPLPQPASPAAVPDTSRTGDGASDGDGPAIADDVDLIEKEWVEKAKTIVNEHKHDPYNQEKEVGRLQADYLQKRYGKNVKREQS